VPPEHRRRSPELRKRRGPRSCSWAWAIWSYVRLPIVSRVGACRRASRARRAVGAPREQRRPWVEAAALDIPSGDRAVPRPGKDREARSDLQEPQNPELPLRVAHDGVGTRPRMSLRIPARRLPLQHLDQHGMLPYIGEIPEMRVSHARTLPECLCGSSACWTAGSSIMRGHRPCRHAPEIRSYRRIRACWGID
jgi:hypothetical protein